jgi:hypothetical protein
MIFLDAHFCSCEIRNCVVNDPDKRRNLSRLNANHPDRQRNLPCRKITLGNSPHQNWSNKMFPIASMMSLVGKKSKFFLTGCTVLMSSANCSYHLNPIRTFYPEWMSRGLVEQIDKLIQNKTQFDEINNHQSIQHLSLTVDLKELRFREQAVRTLTPSGRFIHSQGSKFSLLHAAADLDKGDVIQYLVKHLKMDIDQPDGLQQTPIMYAAQAGGIKALECLSDLGADVNKVDHIGRNVLFHLTAPDELRPVSSPDTFHEDAIKLLVSKGVHIDHTDNRGNDHSKFDKRFNEIRFKFYFILSF